MKPSVSNLRPPKPREFHIKNSTPLLHLVETCHDWLLGDTAGRGFPYEGCWCSEHPPQVEKEHSGGCGQCLHLKNPRAAKGGTPSAWHGALGSGDERFQGPRVMWLKEMSESDATHTNGWVDGPRT